MLTEFRVRKGNYSIKEIKDESKTPLPIVSEKAHQIVVKIKGKTVSNQA
jgi:hypothetical protein